MPERTAKVEHFADGGAAGLAGMAAFLPTAGAEEEAQQTFHRASGVQRGEQQVSDQTGLLHLIYLAAAIKGVLPN